MALCAFVGLPREVVQGYTDQIRERYVLRRTKEDVARFNKRLELPPCDFQNVELEMYPEERQLYADVFSNGQEIVSHIFKTGTQNLHQMELLECLLRVRQVMTWPQMFIDGIALKTDADPEPWLGRSRKMEALLEMIKTHPKEKALVFATRLIDSQYQFGGSRASEAQALQWPRVNCPDPDKATTRVLVSLWLSDGFVPPSVVPKAVVDATCELARELLIADRTAAPPGEVPFPPPAPPRAKLMFLPPASRTATVNGSSASRCRASSANAMIRLASASPNDDATARSVSMQIGRAHV